MGIHGTCMGSGLGDRIGNIGFLADLDRFFGHFRSDPSTPHNADLNSRRQRPLGHANTYDVTAMYWLGMHLSNSLAVLPVLIFFLTLDRCLALNFPLLYSRQMYKWTAVNAIVITVLVYVLSTTFSLLELPLQYSKVKTCSVFTCVLLKFNLLPQFIYKVGFGMANLLLSIYFLWVTRPSVCEESIITGEPLAKYTGLFAAVFVSIDSALCGMYYLIMLTRRNVVESFNSDVMQ
ncbi:hypothetical protein DdX_20272 [Ditylenchus destructor]|uniref:Uncharacterized protein n=1 Tax=Ditylenchus destructor TaxID=166010 RepID=A0AAD4MHG9_9BILA|nr:hypothetical protein DdX_20272 [Ditylenchus destructor]